MTKLPKLITCTLISATASACTVFCVTSGFEIPVNELGILISALLFSFLFTACFIWKKLLWCLIPLAAFLGIIGFFTPAFSSIGPTLIQLAHDILKLFSTAYPNLSFAIPAEPAASLPQSNTLLFMVLAALLSIWMAWGVGYRSCLITAAGTLPFLLLCVIINDTPPHAAPLILLLSCWVTILFAKERVEDIPIIDSVRMILTLMAVLLVLGIIGVVYPKEDTSNQELPQVIQQILDKLPGPMQGALDRNTTGNAPEELGADTGRVLDLTQQGYRQRKDTVMLQISGTETGPIYLKGAAKDIYTGHSWESAELASITDSVYAHTSLGTSFGAEQQASLQIRNLQDNPEVLFAPYGYISCTSADPIVSDLRMSISEKDYVISYWPGVQTLNITHTQGNVNSSYNGYVWENCLQLPDDTRDALYQLALDYGYNPTWSQAKTIAWVAEFIRAAGTYELNAARQPVNEDFAVYFLTESKEGYCVHFATAAAAMYRALGIPARYASGYRAVITEVGGITDVRDLDTHAWAEIYLSGLGWIPVETTPGFGETSMLPELEEEIPQEPSPSPSAEPEEPEEEPEISEEPSPSPSEVPQEPEPSEEPAAPDEDGPHPSDTPGVPTEGVSGAHGISGILIAAGLILGLILLSILVLIIRRAVILSRRKKLICNPDPTLAAVSLWWYVEQLVPYGAEIPDSMKQIALKAKFSRNGITAEEFAPFNQQLLAIAHRVSKQQKGLKGLRFHWIACLTLPK